MKPASTSARFSGLTAKLVLAILLAGLVPAAVIGWVAFSTTNRMAEDIGKSYQELAKSIADKIDRNLFERYGDVQAFGANEAVFDKASWYQVGSEKNKIAAAANRYAALYGFYLLSVVVDLDGKVIAVNDRDPAGKPIATADLYQKNFRETEWFREALAGRFTKTDALDGTYIQDLHADADVARAYNSDGLVLGYTAPIKDASGKVIAIWHNAANFSLVEEIITATYKALKERGLPEAELTLLDRKGRVLVDYDPQRHGGRESVEHDPSVLFKMNLAEGGNAAAKLAVEGKSGHIVSTHIRKGVTQLSGYASCDGALGFPGYRWGVLVRVPEKQALAAMLAARSQVTWVVGASVIGLIVVGLWLARTLARPLLVGVEALGRIGEEVASAAGEVGNASQTVAHSASEQAASLEETSASIEEMNAVTKRNAENAQRGKEIASSARSSAQDGSSRIIEMSRSLATIKSAVAELDGAVREAQASNQEVSKIIKTIDEIAFQTNLLALNAAVEAARAGEAGMGFAVVADEVRALAQRSAQAAKDTTEKIESAIKRSELGGAASRKVAGSLTEVETTARQLEQAFQGIAQQVNSLDAMVAEIAAASQEQTQGIGEISLATTEMDKVTQSNAANAEETASAASHLNTQVGMLLQVAGQLQTVITGVTANSHSAAQEMPEATPAPTRAKDTGTRSVTNGHARNGKGLNGASSRAHTNGNGNGASGFDIPMPDPSAAPAGGFRDF